MEAKQPYCKPEVWGGIECTINRVEHIFRDQLEETGHYQRNDDIEKFAALGFDKMRYPVLWERHQPHEDIPIDWRWITGQLNNLRKHAITPIAGLMHHGSGPAYTHLLDDDFPGKLANYAGMVAQQFPWLEYYTPVNEPLTTARFSGLYGHWYPHHTDELSCVKMVLNQVKGTILSMKKIRLINPSAKLVQTEDLSKIHSTPLLAYQADFENQRRWLSYDLLCGKINKEHYFWQYLIDRGIKEADLFFFLQNACPPEIMGFNYYVTSERYLDEDVETSPFIEGGNHRHRYKDVEAVRSGHAHGLALLLSEAWRRYQIPLAITECHLNCSPGQQLRWLQETWETCCHLNKIGIPVKAVTVWALLGAYDWNSLLINNNHAYEPGAFDISGDNFRETELVNMIKNISSMGKCYHPLTSATGWWHRKETAFLNDLVIQIFEERLS